MDRGGPIVPPITLPSVPWVPDYAWINTPPINIADWRGSPILVDVWNIQCHNCILSLPWMHSLEERYGQRGLKFLGVHTPEFPEDGDADRVRAEVARLGVTTPVVMDNRYDFWRALGTQFWPTLYLADHLGQIRFKKVGQIRPDWGDAKEFEGWIDLLLGEAGQATL